MWRRGAGGTGLEDLERRWLWRVTAPMCALVGLVGCVHVGPDRPSQPIKPDLPQVASRQSGSTSPLTLEDTFVVSEAVEVEAVEVEAVEVEAVEVIEPIPEAASICPGWDEGQRLALSVASPRQVPRVASLTFDDGPDPDKTPKILDILSSVGAPATFFVTGSSINAQTYGLLQRMVTDGHMLANHGYFHSLGLVVHRDREGRSLIGRNLLVNQAVVDVALLARSTEDFKALHGRLFGGTSPNSRRRVLVRDWPALLEAWGEILDERASGKSPAPMHFVRLPGGAPYVGKHWRGVHIKATDDELARLGLVHVLWHSGVGDSDPWRSVEDLRDPIRLGAALDKAVIEGGIITLHDRAPVAHLRNVLWRRASQVEFVELDHYLERAYGCTAAQARVRLWLHHTDAFDGSLCPWFCAGGGDKPAPPETVGLSGGDRGDLPVNAEEPEDAPLPGEGRREP